MSNSKKGNAKNTKNAISSTQKNIEGFLKNQDNDTNIANALHLPPNVPVPRVITSDNKTQYIWKDSIPIDIDPIKKPREFTKALKMTSPYWLRQLYTTWIKSDLTNHPRAYIRYITEEKNKGIMLVDEEKLRYFFKDFDDKWDQFVGAIDDVSKVPFESGIPLLDTRYIQKLKRMNDQSKPSLNAFISANNEDSKLIDKSSILMKKAPYEKPKPTNTNTNNNNGNNNVDNQNQSGKKNGDVGNGVEIDVGNDTIKSRDQIKKDKETKAKENEKNLKDKVTEYQRIVNKLTDAIDNAHLLKDPKEIERGLIHANALLPEDVDIGDKLNIALLTSNEKLKKILTIKSHDAFAFNKKLQKTPTLATFLVTNQLKDEIDTTSKSDIDKKDVSSASASANVSKMSIDNDNVNVNVNNESTNVTPTTKSTTQKNSNSVTHKKSSSIKNKGKQINETSVEQKNLDNNNTIATAPEDKMDLSSLPITQPPNKKRGVESKPSETITKVIESKKEDNELVQYSVFKDVVIKNTDNPNARVKIIPNSNTILTVYGYLKKFYDQSDYSPHLGKTLTVFTQDNMKSLREFSTKTNTSLKERRQFLVEKFKEENLDVLFNVVFLLFTMTYSEETKGTEWIDEAMCANLQDSNHSDYVKGVVTYFEHRNTLCMRLMVSMDDTNATTTTNNSNKRLKLVSRNYKVDFDLVGLLFGMIKSPKKTNEFETLKDKIVNQVKGIYVDGSPKDYILKHKDCIQELIASIFIPICN